MSLLVSLQTIPVDVSPAIDERNAYYVFDDGIEFDFDNGVGACEYDQTREFFPNDIENAGFSSDESSFTVADSVLSDISFGIENEPVVNDAQAIQSDT